MNFREWIASTVDKLHEKAILEGREEYTHTQVGDVLNAALGIVVEELDFEGRFNLHPIGTLHVRQRQVSLFKGQPAEDRPVQRFLSIRMSKSLKARLNPSVIPDDREDQTPQRTPDKPNHRAIDVQLPVRPITGRSQPSFDLTKDKDR